MVSCSRIFCVASPFVITLAALAIFLTVSFGPSAISSLFLFELNLSRLSVDPSTVSSVIARATLPQLTSNVTAADLGLSDIYRVNLWGYCAGPLASNLSCTSPSFDWASHTLNASYLSNVAQVYGVKIVLPTAVSDGLRTFNTSIKWIEVVDVVAIILLGLEIAFSLFTGCSQVMSCLTYVVAGIATSAVAATAIFATVIVVVVVGTLQTQAQPYGVTSTSGTVFLLLLWMVVALCVVAGAFWCITICCCAPDRASRRRRFDDKDQYGHRDTYQPLDSPGQPPYYGGSAQKQQAWQPTTAYEPYMHHA